MREHARERSGVSGMRKHEKKNISIKKQHHKTSTKTIEKKLTVTRKQLYYSVSDK